jgi:ribosome biogenesis GTPase A
LLTPFERNLEVWRQLWRVIERSHLVVQIVDARNPLKFRCEDLEAYVKDVEGAEGEQGTGKGKRRSLLLINKADLLTPNQRCANKDDIVVAQRPLTYLLDVSGQTTSSRKVSSMPSTQLQMLLPNRKHCGRHRLLKNKQRH